MNSMKTKGIHSIHLNVNSLLSKTDEIRYIAASTNAPVIGISESKLGETIHQLEMKTFNYELLVCDRNRNSGGVACYIISCIGYLQKHIFPKEIKNIFVESVLPNIKPLTVGISYRPPNQSNFLEIINASFDKLDTNMKELYILGEFNVNMYQNNEYIVL